MYCLNPNIADQVSVDLKKSNPLSSLSGSIVSALTNDSVSTPLAKRHRYFTDESLSANGLYRVRLFDHTLHLPINCKRITANVSAKTGKQIEAKPKCDLHHWLGGQLRSKVMYCETCNVNLCIHCYTLFHTNPHLVAKKQQLKRKYNIK